MSESIRARRRADLVSARRLAGSQAFSALFRDGMALVEETAAYLDGPGRKESKALPRAAALAYATESMRLTTRLMQLASWLLLHRAVKEGEMSLAQVNQEKTKVKLVADLLGRRGHAEDACRRRWSTDRPLACKLAGAGAPARRHHPRRRRRRRRTPDNPVEHQLGMLKAAFEREGLSLKRHRRRLNRRSFILRKMDCQVSASRRSGNDRVTSSRRPS